MKSKFWKILWVTIISSMIFTGCGAADKATESAESTQAYAMNDVYAPAGAQAAVEEEANEGSGNTKPTVSQTQRKLIKNVNMEVETEAFDELLMTLTEKTKRLGGYIEESYTYNGSNYRGKENRSASLTIRIPAQSLDEFITDVADSTNVISKNESASDVTLQYVDMESHKESLLIEQKRLQELLEKAETIEDIITIESRLSEVRYQIESMESQLRTMDNQVSYSTIYLNIIEVKSYTPVKEQSIGEKIITGFSASLSGVGRGIVNFFVGFIIILPYLILWGIIITIIILVIKAFSRRGTKKREKKEMEAKKENKDKCENNE